MKTHFFPVLQLHGNPEEVFSIIQHHLYNNGFRIKEKSLEKPWGGFFVIDETQAKEFAAYYFPEVDFGTIRITENLSPKILAVAPGKRLSWQYHFRRAEIWRLVAGQAAITTSDDDVERHNREIRMGEVIRLKQGERHRLIGMDDWGMIAEIWQHTVPGYLSDEADIIRIQDDFVRK